MTWFYAFAAFAALIVLHEFGHFAAAKAVGMQVTRFSLFFPPALLKLKRGETSYEIGAVPFGGFVKITGMNPEEEIPAGGEGRAYFQQPVWKRIVVIAAGPAMNLLIAFVLVFVLFAFVDDGSPQATNRIGDVSAGAPAAAALVAGDRLLAVNGRTGSNDALIAAIGRSKCVGRTVAGCPARRPVSITVLRGGEYRSFVLTPRWDAAKKRMRLGFALAAKPTTEPPGTAFTHAASAMWNVTKMTFAIPARVFNAQQRKQISSTVGAYEGTRKAFSAGTANVLAIVALISLSLAVINLFPFLPLDGGHIFWALAEKVRGRPFPIAVLERASIVGIALIAMLFMIGLTNDIGRIANGGFGS